MSTKDSSVVRSAARTRVLELLESNKNKWVPGFELTQPTIGGSEGLRRLRELRKSGYNIQARKMKASTAWEYKLCD